MATVKGPDSAEERLERMVSLYQLPLLRLCCAYLRDAELARGAVQETFLKACRSMDRFREAASEKTWLCRIAINTCKDMRKAAWFRHEDRSVSLDRLPPPAAPAADADLRLAREIMALPGKLKEAALLCWLQGMTYEEAAVALGITHQAVAGRLNRARKKLRGALEGRDGYDL